MNNTRYGAIHAQALDLHHDGNSEKALAVLKAHLSKHAEDALGYYVLGTVFIERMEPGRAIKAFKAAIEHGLDTAETRTALATVYFHFGQSDSVDEHLEAAFLHDQTFPLARLLEARKAMKANPEAALEKALSLASDEPELFDTYPFLSGLYRTQFGDLDRAQICLDRAIGLDRRRVEVLEEQAGLYLDRAMPNAARQMAQEVLETAPNSKAGVLMMALAELTLGHFAQGWSFYARRREHAPQHAKLRFGDVPLWQGEDISNQTILVWTDQSVGDEILYASMLPDLEETAGQVILACAPRMVPVFARSFPNVSVIPDAFHDGGESPKPTADVQICLPDLGGYFRSELSDFPDRASYLVSDPAKVAQLRERYQDGRPDQALIGISWRSQQAGFGAAKTTDLLDWKPVLEKPGYRFVSLQYGDVTADLSAVLSELDVEIVRDPEIDALTDMDEAMAQVAAMDQVISTSNTTVHMAASQGRPTTLALPQGRKTVWYWGIAGEACAFYPSLRVVRTQSAYSKAAPSFGELFEAISGRL